MEERPRSQAVCAKQDKLMLELVEWARPEGMESNRPNHPAQRAFLRA
jgi:hypothetical protein